MTPPDSPDVPTPEADALPMQLLRAFLSQTPLIPGRRAFFRYRDLGLEQATHGRMRANVSSMISSNNATCALATTAGDHSRTARRRDRSASLARRCSLSSTEAMP